MEENTSKAYVESSGLIAGALPSTEAGSPLFLINLCASMAPVQLASKSLPGLESYRLYQVTRVEDGRTRYRLRLGFFPTEREAEEVLAKVREQYPTAFAACLCEEDRRHTRGYVVSAPAAKPAMTIVASNPPKAVASTAQVPAAKPTAAAQPAVTKAPAAAAKPAAATKPVGKPAPVASATAPTAKDSMINPPAAVAPKPAQAKKTPVAKPSSFETELEELEELSWDPPALTASMPQLSAAPAKEQTGKHPVQTVPAGFKSQPVIKAKTPTPPPPTSSIKLDAGASMRVKALELTFSDPPPAPSPKPAPAASNQPFHVGKGVEIPAVQLSLQADTPSAAKPQAAAASAGKAASIKPTLPASANPPQPAAAAVQAKAPPPAAAKPAMPGKTPSANNPDLDSTQTIRALTNEELADEAQEKWFAIQLAASEQPVNLDAMPHLDIFEAYRLYSIAIAGSGKIIHSLRLGFFKEAVSAEAVAGYLKTFFGSPSVLRISVAEQARFKDATLPKKPTVPESKAQANVVEISSARNPRTSVPTVTMEVVDPAATGSFKMNNTGSFRTSDTAKHRTLPPAGMKPAAKSAPPAVKRSPPVAKKTSTTGKYKAPSKKSLAEQLLDEAKEVELSESGIYKMPKNDSLLSRLVDKLKK